MSRPSTLGSDAEMQLAELQRKYRIMEGNRKSYSEDSQKTIVQQRQTIEKLKQDNNSLKSEIALHKKRELAPMTASMKKSIHKAQEQADFYSHKIEEERMKADQLKREIELFRKQSMETRRNMGGVNAARENTQNVGKQIKILENRLDKALVKFNEALAQNKSLRNQIDNLRRERVVFDQIYRKLEKELQEKKREMTNVIEVSNVAYEARDQAQNEIAALRAQSDWEQSSFEDELQGLNQVIDSDAKLHLQLRRASILRANAHVEQINALKARKANAQIKVVKDKVSKQQKVQTYEEAFQKIKDSTGTSDIDELVKNFIVSEEQNFSLYNYLNDLSRESEKLDEQIEEIKQEIERYKDQDEASENYHKQLAKEYEEKIAACHEKTERQEQNYQAVVRALSIVKNSIVSICNKSGCNAVIPKELLVEGVTESNILQYLAVVEQRATELTMMFVNSTAYQAISDNQSEMRSQGQYPTTASIFNLQIDPPSTTFDSKDDSSDSEDEQEDRPLTRNELKEKTAINLIKRNERAKKKKSKN